MKNVFPIIALIIFATGCQNGKGGKQKSGTKLPPNQDLQCFLYQKGNDTILLSFDIQENRVNGNLVYNFYEKDKNKGTINGKISSDTLFADYTFISEGIQSKRQVVFLKRGENYIEGRGEINEQSGVADLSGKSKILFDNSFSLRKIPCQKED